MLSTRQNENKEAVGLDYTPVWSFLVKDDRNI